MFVHLRDQSNSTVAQADHVLFGVHDNVRAIQGEWDLIRDNGGWLRDGTVILLPDQLSAGEYQLFMGLYDPTTFERYPITDDYSGENALPLLKITIS